MDKITRTGTLIADSVTAGNVSAGAIARCVYLVNDPSDSTRMGGTAQNTYTNWQTAYDAALAVWVALGSTVGVKVAIKIGVTTAAVVGDLTLTLGTAYNADIILIGTSKSASVLGNIVATSASTSGSVVTLNAVECTIGNITTSTSAGTTFSGGAVSLTGDFIAGNIDTTATTSTSGVGGAVTLNSVGGRSSCGSITTTGGSTGTAGALTVTNGYSIGAVVTSGGATAPAGAISITDSFFTSLTGVSNATGYRTLTVVRSVGTGSVAISSLLSTALWNIINITESTFGSYTHTKTVGGTNTAGNYNFRRVNCTSFTLTIGAGITSSTSVTMDSCVLTGTALFTNNSTTGSGTINLLATSNIIDKIQHVGNSSGAIVADFRIKNNVLKNTAASLDINMGNTGMVGAFDGCELILIAQSNDFAGDVRIGNDNGTSQIDFQNNSLGSIDVPKDFNLTVGSEADSIVTVDSIWENNGTSIINYLAVGNANETHTITIDDSNSLAYTSTGGLETVTIIPEFGIYTPTLTNTTNVDSSTAYSCQYLRNGKSVTVSGRVDVDLAATVATELEISLPITSAFANANECAGTAFCPTVAGYGAAILANVANGTASMQWVANDAGSRPIYFQFTYRIL